ncbi:Fc.00g106020.m01.CDS01 [Cosmosporella sp. VM-42]
MTPSLPQSASKRKFRKHVTTACTQCRESKVKCDGTTPVCGSCLRKGKECQYDARADQRKLSPRIAIELLSSRVNQLSKFITDNRLKPPPLQQPGNDKTPSVILHTLGLEQLQPRSSELTNASSTDQTDNSILPESMDHTEPSVDLYTASWSMATTSNGDMDRLQSTLDTEVQLPLDSSATLDDYGPESSQDSENELAEQLSNRIGTLQIRLGGHIRFFGSTSNFHLLEMPGTDGTTSGFHPTVQKDGMKYLDLIGLGKHVPSEIEEHLTNLYFAWQDPSSHVVDRRIFGDAKARWHSGQDTPYYSEALENSICAVGAAFDARYHPAFVTFPRSLSEFFADRAKALLEIELNSPLTVATVQTLVILSAHENGIGRDARAWLYSGMAMRLAYLLALDQNLTQYIEKGLLTPAEAELRRVVFWGACVVDHAWSFQIGQPFRFSPKDATAAKPSPRQVRAEQWTAYVVPTSPSTALADYTDLVCRYQASLIENMGPLSTTVYGDVSIPKSTLQEINARTVAKLLKWKDTLPFELQVNNADRSTPCLPHVLIMHMQYHQAIIYAHRPYMSKSYLQPQPPQGPGARHARQMCIDSASSIAKLLCSYEARYSLRRMNIQTVAITFSAALPLLFTTISRQLPREDVLFSHLGTCFRALDELGSTWESAKRARDFIARLQRHWDIQYSSSNWPGRPAKSQSKSTASGEGLQASGTSNAAGGSAIEVPRRGNQWNGFSNDAIAVDFDLDWMLTADLQGMSPDWGSFFTVTSGDMLWSSSLGQQLS